VCDQVINHKMFAMNAIKNYRKLDKKKNVRLIFCWEF
jgi:hypothetical protein